VQPRIEAGQVLLPNPRLGGHRLFERAWVDDFVETCALFPRGEHDDDVDALTQLLVYLSTPRAGEGFLEFARQEVARMRGESAKA
jgi:predicted phage terminase large subunit-like protein